MKQTYSSEKWREAGSEGGRTKSQSVSQACKWPVSVKSAYEWRVQTRKISLLPLPIRFTYSFNMFSYFSTVMNSTQCTLLILSLQITHSLIFSSAVCFQAFLSTKPPAQLELPGYLPTFLHLSASLPPWLHVIPHYRNPLGFQLRSPTHPQRVRGKHTPVVSLFMHQ